MCGVPCRAVSMCQQQQTHEGATKQEAVSAWEEERRVSK